MGQLYSKLIFIILFALIGGCVDKLSEVGSESFCPGKRLDDGSCPYAASQLSKKSWDLSRDYKFDSSKLELVDGVLSNKKIQTFFKGEELLNGSYIGSSLNDNSHLTIETSKSSKLVSVKKILPSKVDNLIAHWDMENTVLSSGNAEINSRMYSSVAYNVDSKVGTHSLTRSGGQDGILVDNFPHINNALTVTSWIKVDSNNPWRRVFGEGDTTVSFDWVFVENTTGDFKFEMRTSNGTCSTNYLFKFPQSKWVHFAATFGDGYLKVYMDGIQVYKNTCTGTINNTGNNLVVGADINGWSSFDGSLDEFSVWDTTLSIDEIRLLYEKQSLINNQLSKSWTPHWKEIIAYWKMDNSWKDYSSQMLDLSVIGDDVTFQSAKVGSQAVAFGGVNDYLRSSSENSDYSEGFTIGGWVKPKKLGSWQGVIWKGGGTNLDFQLIFQGNNTFFCRYINATAQVSVSEPVVLNHKDSWSHVMCSLDTETQKLTLYVDGEVSRAVDTGGLLPPSVSAQISVGHSAFEGEVDDIAIWKKGLKGNEIKLIYERQRNKFSGIYESKILDLGSKGKWSSLKTKVDIPYLKEIDLTSDSLSNGVISYWKFNESSLGSVGGADIKDYSANNNHLSQSGGVILNAPGILSSGIKLDGINDYVSVANNPSLQVTSDVSLSIWMKSNGDLGDSNAYGGLIGKTAFGGDIGYGLRIYNSSYEFIVRQTNGQFKRSVRNSTPKIVDGLWHHIVGIANSSDGTVRVYVDGILQTNTIQTGFTGAIQSNNYELAFGRDYGNAYFNGTLDEGVVWNRAISESEVMQLYRRGANRIKYQTRTCETKDCIGEAWKGFDGLDDSFHSLLKTASTDPHNYVLELEDNRYFQYRVLMESFDRNNACAGKSCLPTLEEVSISPSERYYSGEVKVEITQGLPYKLINGITADSTCHINAQISPNGVDYYYWDGDKWAAQSSETNHSPLEIVTKKIKAFSRQFPNGTFYAKLFLKSSGETKCLFKGLSLEKLK